MPGSESTADLVPEELATLVETFLPGAGAALYTTGSQPAWQAGTWRDGELDETGALCAAAASRPFTAALASGRHALVSAVAEGTNTEERASLAVVGERSDGSHACGVAALAALLAKVLRLNRELDGMAAELSDRYEELNLVYATGDSAIRGRSSRAALDELVRSCRIHLNVSLVCLVMPKQRIALESHDERGVIKPLPNFLRAVGAAFFATLQTSGCSIVFNDGSAPPELRDFGSMKLAAIPIRDGADAICGALVGVNPADSVDFSNSDRNLLTAIAEKAAQIIANSYDSLTGLYCRAEFQLRLEALFAESLETGAEHYLLCIYVDGLRVFNETLGPDAGDAVLKSVAAQLEKQQNDERVLARLGGDDFALVLRNSDLAEALEVAETIRASVRAQQLCIGDQPIAVTVSIGIARMDRQAESAAAVLRGAELASGVAHEQARDGVHIYRDGGESVVRRSTEMRWVGKIHTALRNDAFRLYAQVIQPLGHHDDTHLEILLRLIDEDGTLHSPGEFLPAAERYYLMPAIDRWVIRHSLAMLANAKLGRWPLCAINLSGQSMNDPSFIDFVLGAVKSHDVPGSRICFEITETAALKSMEAAKDFILRLKQHGCRFSLDDFGTGLSSFSYLKTLPVDFVKIDGSFVKNIVEDAVSESMVRAITEVGHAMGLGIIAEYVESSAIRAKVKSLGVDFAQGFAIERPVELAEMLARKSVERTKARA